MYTFICFHGCGQLLPAFRLILNTLQTHLKKRHQCEFHFIQGNYKLPDKGYAWYDNDNPTDHLKNIQATFFDLQNKENVILLGFSEGGRYALELALLNQTEPNNPIKAVIALAPSYVPSRTSACTLPVLLVVSPQDEMVTRKESLKWARHFSQLTVCETNKGHKICFTENIRTEIDKLLV